MSSVGKSIKLKRRWARGRIILRIIKLSFTLSISSVGKSIKLKRRWGAGGKSLSWNFIYVQWTGSSHSLNAPVFTVLFTQLIHSTHPHVLFALPIWLPWSSPSCSPACHKIVLVPLGLKISASWSMLHTLDMRNCNLMLFVCLLVCRTVKFLHMCTSGLSKLIFHLLRGKVSVENCHFRLPGHILISTILIHCLIWRKKWV